MVPLLLADNPFEAEVAELDLIWVWMIPLELLAPAVVHMTCPHVGGLTIAFKSARHAFIEKG